MSAVVAHTQRPMTVSPWIEAIEKHSLACGHYPATQVINESDFGSHLLSHIENSHGASLSNTVRCYFSLQLRLSRENIQELSAEVNIFVDSPPDDRSSTYVCHRIPLYAQKRGVLLALDPSHMAVIGKVLLKDNIAQNARQRFQVVAFSEIDFSTP